MRFNWPLFLVVALLIGAGITTDFLWDYRESNSERRLLLSEETELTGRFSEGCPPQWALVAAREYKHRPNQAFPQKFLDSFVFLETYDGTQVMKLESRGFCVFKIQGLVFVLFNDYEDVSGVRVLGRQDLQNYLGDSGINTDICEIIWSQCHDEPNEVPEEPEDEEIDGEALVLRQLHERPLFF